MNEVRAAMQMLALAFIRALTTTLTSDRRSQRQQ